MIRKCKKGDGQKGKPWCLYTKDGSRLLGRHKTKEDCYKQEAAIKAHGSVVQAGLPNNIMKALKDAAEKLGGEYHRRGFNFGWTFKTPNLAQKFFRDISSLGVRPTASGPFTVMIYAEVKASTLLATLDSVAEELDRVGDADLASEVDEAASFLFPPNEHREEQLRRVGFDDVVDRNRDVAEEIVDEDPSPFPYENLEY